MIETLQTRMIKQLRHVSYISNSPNVYWASVFPSDITVTTVGSTVLSNVGNQRILQLSLVLKNFISPHLESKTGVSDEFW